MTLFVDGEIIEKIRLLPNDDYPDIAGYAAHTVASNAQYDDIEYEFRDLGDQQ